MDVKEIRKVGLEVLRHAAPRFLGLLDLYEFNPDCARLLSKRQIQTNGILKSSSYSEAQVGEGQAAARRMLGAKPVLEFLGSHSAEYESVGLSLQKQWNTNQIFSGFTITPSVLSFSADTSPPKCKKDRIFSPLIHQMEGHSKPE